MRAKTKNDVAQINNSLKYMNSRIRVKTEGLRADAGNPKTAEQIKAGIKSHEHAGLKYDVGANFRKSSSFKTDEEMHASIKKGFETIPEGVKSIINNSGTKVTFVNRNEIKALRAGVSNAAGFYDPIKKQIYVYPAKSTYGTQFLIPEKSVQKLKERGYTDEFITNFRRKIGKGSFESTVVHELAHAIALNDTKLYEGRQDPFNAYERYKEQNENALQIKYDDFRRKLYQDVEFNHEIPSSITRYANTNSQEDFAEHFAYYATHKQFVDDEIKNNSTDIYTPKQLEKFKWMKKEVWTE
jgi:hypothetical protein